jgi:hypothetical protein
MCSRGGKETWRRIKAALRRQKNGEALLAGDQDRIEFYNALTKWRQLGYEARLDKKMAANPELTREQAKSRIGNELYSARLDKKMAANPELSREQAKSRIGDELYSAKLDKKMAANPTLSREQAKSQIAAPGAQARKDSIDRKFNRKSNVVFVCLGCAKVGVVSHKLFPVDGTHTSGLQKGCPKLGNKRGGTCPNKECNKGQHHTRWIAVKEKKDVAKLKANTMPDWIQSLCDNNMCPEANCYNKRYQRHKVHYDKCEKHMSW